MATAYLFGCSDCFISRQLEPAGTYETFVLGATAPSEARSIPAKELGMKMDRSMKAASRFIPTKVEKSQRMTSHASNLPKPVKL